MRLVRTLLMALGVVCVGLAATLLSTATAWAAGESVTGVIRDEGDPVVGVVVAVEDESGAEVGSDISDETGRWEVPVPGPGPYVVILDTDSLPDDVVGVVRDTVETEVGPSQSKAVLFRVGAPEDDAGSGTDTAAGSTSNQAAQLAVEGLRFGFILALASLGLSLVFGTTGLTNFSHGELVTFGAIVAWYINDAGAILPLAALLAVLAAGLFGWGQDRALWRPLRRRRTGLIAMMIVSVGLAVFLRYAYLYVFGGARRSYNEYAVQSGIEIGPVSLAPRDFWTVAIAVVALGLVVLALSRTRLGKATRAVADNPALSRASGIDVDRVIKSVWIVGAMLAGLAGVLLGLSQQVDYQMGFKTLLLVFAAVILGGLGTVWGSILGALLLGVVLQMSTLVLPAELKNAAVLVVLIVVLLVRPQGLLGRPQRVG